MGLNTIKWNDGRRVVEIGVLEEGLICTECEAVLSLLDITEQTWHGLGSFLYVTCHACGWMNCVPTGKTHMRPGVRNGFKDYQMERWETCCGDRFAGRRTDLHRLFKQYYHCLLSLKRHGMVWGVSSM